MTHKSSASRLYLNTENKSSTSQLIDPPLYFIYGGRNTIDTENQNDFGVEVYGQVKSPKSPHNPAFLIDSPFKNNVVILNLINISKTLALGYIMFYLFNSLHFSNPEIIPVLLPPMLSSNRFPISFDFDKHISTVVGINLLILDFILHFLVSIFPRSTKDNDNSIDKRSTSTLQLFVALAGIIYLFKKISWSSTLQADSMFLLINIFYSKYIDCSVLEILNSLLLSIISYLYDSLIIEQCDENSLWRGCFIFFLCVNFIKLKKSVILF